MCNLNEYKNGEDALGNWQVFLETRKFMRKPWDNYGFLAQNAVISADFRLFHPPEYPEPLSPLPKTRLRLQLLIRPKSARPPIPVT